MSRVKKTDASAGLATCRSETDVSGIIAMAWQDDTPFEAIALQFGLNEAQVIALMREHLKARSFRVWRMRVRGRAAKHLALHAERHQPEHSARSGWASTSAQELLQHSPEDFPLPPSSITRHSLR
jgi:uncharacterized protein (TIGR03643 family)